MLTLPVALQKINMGLDLYHVIPSLKTSETLDYFTMDEFESNPDFLKKHLQVKAFFLVAGELQMKELIEAIVQKHKDGGIEMYAPATQINPRNKI